MELTNKNPRGIVLFLFVLATFSYSVAAQQDSSRLSPVNWMRVKKIDIKHITIDLRFDWTKKQAYGSAVITLSPITATGMVALDAAMLTIQSISLSTGAPLKFSYSGDDKNDNLQIGLNRMYAAGEDLTIKIDYRTNWINATDPNNTWGSTGKGIRFFEPSSTDPRRRQQVWTMGEPESNRYWFPCFDSPNDFRTTDFRATVDKKLMVISNGKLVETKNNNDGTHSFFYKMDQPYPNHKTGFIVGDYVDIKQNYEDILLHTFSYPDEKEAAEATVVRLPDMVGFFSAITGVRYPYPDYSQVAVQELPWGHGNGTFSIQTENMIDDFRTHADFFYLWDGLEAETLAQQWFGNYLSCNDWSHVWLNRSFARHLDGLYCEHKNGREEYLLYNHLLFDNNSYLADWNAGIRHPVVTVNYENVVSFTSDNYSYFRGALVLHMIRKYLGEENWRKTIRHYVKSNAYKPVSTEDFRKAIEETTGEPMDWFFDQWVYKMGHPVFKVVKNYNNEKKQLSLLLKQVQQIDSSGKYPQVAFFQGKMEIEIDDKIQQVWIAAKEENGFTFPLPERPNLVNIDYETTWIKEISFEKSLDELLYQLRNDQDILGKHWAMGELVSLAKNEKTATGDKERIYEGLRNTISSNSYWRLKYMALLQLQGLLTASAGNKPVLLDSATAKMLLAVIRKEQSWNRAAAINFLGLTRDAKYDTIYLGCFNDDSDRVINAAATALGRSKSPKAFKALEKLKDKPSWKNQSLISALNGLKEARDARGFKIALDALKDTTAAPRWTLSTPVWDFRIAAAETLVALGKTATVYPVIFEKFKKSIAENNVNDIFNNVLLLTTLADPRGQEVFDILKEKFKEDANAMIAVNQYETQFKEAIIKR